MAYAMLAICVRRIPFALTFMLFLGVLAFDLVWTISVSFGLAPSELVTALDHARHFHVFQPPLYGALIGDLRRDPLPAVPPRNAASVEHRRDFCGSAAVCRRRLRNKRISAQVGAMLGRNVPIESAVAKSGFNGVLEPTAATSVSKLALDLGIGPADILIVGDHSPPLWWRHARAIRARARGVVRLAPRDGAVAVNRAQKTSAAR